MICIYSVINNINNKRYIGQTIDSHSRKIKHFTSLKTQKHHSIKLQNAFNKYQENNFSFDILLECNQDELNDMEKYYIWLYDSYENGYNHNLGSNDRSNQGVEFVYKGKKYKNIKKTAIEMGLKPKQLHARLRYGRKECRWNIKKCIWNNIEYTSIADAARANNIKYETMRQRILKGKNNDNQIRNSYANLTKP